MSFQRHLVEEVKTHILIKTAYFSEPPKSSCYLWNRITVTKDMSRVRMFSSISQQKYFWTEHSLKLVSSIAVNHPKTSKFNKTFKFSMISWFYCEGTFTQSYFWRQQIAEILTLYAHKWECPHFNDKWSPRKLMASRWFFMALPRRWRSDFLWRDHRLYIIIYVRIHKIDTSDRHKIRKYKKHWRFFRNLPSDQNFENFYFPHNYKL